MSEKLHRAMWAFLAALFIFTGVGIGAISVWQSVKSDNKNKSTNNQGDKTVNNKLAGTQLANFTPVTHVDSLQKIDTQVGTGAEVKQGDTITANYTGAIASTGLIFQSSLDSGQPFTAKVQLPSSANGGQGLIQGWVEGIPGMKAGGTRRLLIPASLAYGANPPAGSGIPANADLVFDITLISVQ